MHDIGLLEFSRVTPRAVVVVPTGRVPKLLDALEANSSPTCFAEESQREEIEFDACGLQEDKVSGIPAARKPFDPPPEPGSSTCNFGHEPIHIDPCQLTGVPFGDLADHLLVRVVHNLFGE